MLVRALGDFDPTPTTAEALDSTLRGRVMGFPDETRALVAELIAPGGAWLGLAEEERPDGDFDVLLWPKDERCELGHAPAYPASAGGQALGWSSASGVLLVAGELTSTADSARALYFDARRGVASEVEGGMVPGRAFATVTPFGDALIVAGGLDPRTSSSGAPADGRPIASGVVFEPETGRFDRARLVPLSVARARHAAVVLPSGETLLVGGVGEGGVALGSLDAISPRDRAPREVGLATLAEARVAPVALTLDDGRILVAGGTGRDGAPVGRLEFLSADASQASFGSTSVPPRFDRAFVAMPGGGALAVGGCATRGGTGCRDAWWITPEGVAERLPDLPVETPHPALVPAANGAPWLVAGPDDARELLRFDPWQAAFVVPPGRPRAAPAAELPAPLALDPGAFVWLARGAEGLALEGLRFDTRGRFAFDVAPLFTALPPDGSFPVSQAAHVAPDRSPVRDGAEARFAPTSGLTLEGDDATALITDARYLTVELRITLGAGSPPRVLAGERILGGADCPWPEGSEETLELELVPGSATLTRGAKRVTCSAPAERIALGFRAGPTQKTTLRAVEVRRGAR